MLNIVRMPSSRLGPMACFMAGWSAGAKRKPMPASSTARAVSSGGRSSLTPRASSTSALPERLDTERFPCLATFTPAPAATKAAVVETLKVEAPSPPVPQVSSRGSFAGRLGRMGTTFSRITWAAPVISSTVSPLTLSPMSRAPVCASVACPSII